MIRESSRPSVAESSAVAIIARRGNRGSPQRLATSRFWPTRRNDAKPAPSGNRLDRRQLHVRRRRRRHRDLIALERVKSDDLAAVRALAGAVADFGDTEIRPQDVSGAAKQRMGRNGLRI